jgi:alpha-tubulin suppressor-like RCC1 family protein
LSRATLLLGLLVLPLGCISPGRMRAEVDEDAGPPPSLVEDGGADAMSGDVGAPIVDAGDRGDDGGLESSTAADGGSARDAGNGVDVPASDAGTEPAPGPQIQQIVAGERHTCALIQGDVLCWGNDFFGQIGDGPIDQTDKLRPTAVIGLGEVKAISAGAFHTCAIEVDGRVQCWGSDSSGQIGDGVDATDKYSPVYVQGLSDVAELSLGAAHSCAVTSGGVLRCWGSEDDGRLGTGPSDEGDTRDTPFTIASLSNIQSVAAGGEHTCALNAEDRALCWGRDSYGQVGNGPISQVVTYDPTLVVDVTDALAVTVGESHSCAVLLNRTAMCWGRDTTGAVGDGPEDEENKTRGVPVVGLQNVISIALGGLHSCALVSDTPLGESPTAEDLSGSVWCWGRDAEGQVGDGVFYQGVKSSPVKVSGLEDIRHLALGDSHSCAATSEDMYCWGEALHGRLGGREPNYAIEKRYEPNRVEDLELGEQ